MNCGFSVDASGESQVSVANVAAFRLGVASAVMGRSRPNECPSFGLSSSRLCESPALAVPLGTPTGEMNSLKGVGARPNFL